jgi:hypothetical protein
MTTALTIIERDPLVVYDGGTNHGGRGLLPHVADFQRKSNVIDVKIIGVDPIPGRANQFVQDAAAHGLRAQAREAKIEDVITEGVGNALIILNMDAPRAHAAALASAADTDSPVLGALYATAPADGQLYGIRYVCLGEEHEHKQELARLFASLAAFGAKGGRERVWGERGRPEHRPLERVYRDWTGTFVRENLAKIAVGLPSNNHHIELTRDGTHTLPVIIRESPQGWASPFTLAVEVLGNPPAPILRGDEFVIAELRPEGARFHFARLGKTDGRVRVNGYAGFDQETLDVAERAERERQVQHEAALQLAERERQTREVAEAVRRAEQKTISRRRPLFFTD